MDKTYKYEAFKSIGEGGRKPKDHVMIQLHLVYNVKQGGRRKVSHMTGPNTDTYYSSVVSLKAMRMRIFLAELK
eukprot:12330561-Ditylum_brightwellii.AAC.1